MKTKPILQKQQKPERRGGDDRTASTASNSIDSKESPDEEDAYNVGALFSYVTSCGNRDTTSESSAFLNCGGRRSMQRASAARRSEHSTAAGVRARSSEPAIMAPENEDIQGGSGHCRSLSDPFDTAAFEDAISPSVTTDEEEDEFYAASMSNLSISEHTTSLPTFQRYPCVESRNKNCWSEPPVSIFSVRGANYFGDKVKVPSEPYLLQARGSDVFLTDSKKPFCLSQIKQSILGGQLLKQPTLAINFRFPWGYMILYFEVPSKLSPYMRDDDTDTTTDMDPSFTVAEQTLAKWLLGDTHYKNERLKLIPYVAEGPWVVRNMVTGRPAIIGKKLPVSYQFWPESTEKGQKPLLMATLDIGNSSATAKRIVSVCRRYMSSLTVDIGFVIQSQCAAELPEQMLGAMRIHGPDPLKAPKLN